MMQESHLKSAAVFLIVALVSALLGLAIVLYQPPVLLIAVLAVLAVVILLGRSPAADYLAFFALFSGPPRIRARDPLASLQGEIDWVVILHIMVWLIGALWVARQLFRYLVIERKAVFFTWMHFLAVLLSALLGLSLIVSPGPLLTLFRALQMLVMILFALMWVEKNGIGRTLNALFWGYAVLALVTGAAAILMPALVFAGERVRGDYIANTGVVGAMGFVLLLSYPPPLKRWLTIPLLGLFVTLLIFSMTRSSYIAVMIFLALAAIRRPKVSSLRSMYLVLGMLVLMLLLLRLMPAVLAWIIRDPGSLATFSERIPLWKYLIPIMWQKSPYLGLGFYAASRVYALQQNAAIGTAHNAFVELLVGGGIISFLVFLAVLAGVLVRSFALFLRRGKKPEVFVSIALLSTALCIGMVSEEMLIASPTALTFWIVLSVILELGRTQRTPEAEVA
jgi:hypothetical protein